MAFLQFCMENKPGLFRRYFKSLMFGGLSYAATCGVFILMESSRYLRKDKYIIPVLLFLLVPSLVFSFFNLKINKTTKYKINIRSILSYSLTIVFVFIIHILSVIKMENIEKTTLIRFLIPFAVIFGIAFSIAHISYLFILALGKQKVKEDLIDN